MAAEAQETAELRAELATVVGQTAPNALVVGPECAHLVADGAPGVALGVLDHRVRLAFRVEPKCCVV